MKRDIKTLRSEYSGKTRNVAKYKEGDTVRAIVEPKVMCRNPQKYVNATGKIWKTMGKIYVVEFSDGFMAGYYEEQLKPV